MPAKTPHPNLTALLDLSNGDQQNLQGTGFALYLQDARDHVLFYDWCDDIVAQYLGTFHDGIIGIFLFKISTSRVDVDEWLWVVVGDLPPTYLTLDLCPDTAGALEGYIGAMQEWVEAAASGESVADLVPVNVPATPENALLLKRRLQFLATRILPGL